MLSVAGEVLSVAGRGAVGCRGGGVLSVAGGGAVGCFMLFR